MPLKLILEILIFCILMFIIVLTIVKRGRITIKYSLVWFIPVFLILVCALIPNLMITLANFLGFQTLSNMIFSILIAILIFICISLTIIVSKKKKKIKLLIQEVSILKEEIENMRDKDEK